MKYLLSSITLPLLSTLAFGQVPNTFSSGETISSSKINANFSFLANAMGSGNITAEELKHILCNLDEPLTQTEVDWIVDEADVDGDGTISFDEFKKMMMSCGAVR